MKRPKLHPACEIFPALGEIELQELADDIAQNGLQNPIVLYQGKILDGRNRFEACKIAKIKPQFAEFQGDDPIGWVISQNLTRRHLTASQRAVIALDLLPLLEQEAKDRQRMSKGRGKKGRKNSVPFSGNGEAAENVARITKSNAKYVRSVKQIKEQAPELIERIRVGQVTVQDASTLAKLTPTHRAKVLDRANGAALNAGELRILTKQVEVEARQRSAKAFAKKNSRHQNIIIGDMKILWKRINDGSVDLFLSDPPYDTKSVPQAYDHLAELAAAKLRPGGLCVVYAGQIHLPRIMDAMEKHLTYWWTFAVKFSGQPQSIYSRHLQNRWRLILSYCKPPVQPAPDWLSDLIEGGGRDKSHHEWGQNVNEVQYLIERLTEPNMLVVDTYCGAGTVPLACHLTGRRWIATEIDETAAMIARQRLADHTR